MSVNGTGSSSTQFDYGRGNPNRVELDCAIGGGARSGMSWTITYTNHDAVWGSTELGAVFDPSSGLTLDLHRGNLEESFRHRMLRVQVDRM